MALSRETLDRIAEQLSGPLAEVQATVQSVVDAEHAGPESMPKNLALDRLVAATDNWLNAASDVEGLLLDLQGLHDRQGLQGLQDDAADAHERLGGIALVHLAVAADLARLAPIDNLQDGDPVSAADVLANPNVRSAIQAITGNGPDEGRLLEALTLAAELADARDGDDGDQPAKDVLTELVDRAGVGVRSVLVGAAPSPHVAFLVVRPALEAALNAAPDAITHAVTHIGRSIAKLVMKILRRVRDVLNNILGEQYVGEVINKLLDRTKAVAQKDIVDPLVRDIVAGILGETKIAEQIRHTTVVRKQTDLQNHTQTPAPDNKDALRKLLKRNHRWVRRPVPVAARHLHPLWAVGPAATPIAAALLVAWTILYTGDQLDSPGPFPNFCQPGLMNLKY